MPNQTNDFEEWEWLRVGMGKEGTSQSPPRLNLNLTADTLAMGRAEATNSGAADVEPSSPFLKKKEQL